MCVCVCVFVCVCAREDKNGAEPWHYLAPWPPELAPLMVFWWLSAKVTACGKSESCCSLSLSVPLSAFKTCDVMCMYLCMYVCRSTCIKPRVHTQACGRNYESRSIKSQ